MEYIIRADKAEVPLMDAHPSSLADFIFDGCIDYERAGSHHVLLRHPREAIGDGDLLYWRGSGPSWMVLCRHHHRSTWHRGFMGVCAFSCMCVPLATLRGDFRMCTSRWRSCLVSAQSSAL